MISSIERSIEKAIIAARGQSSGDLVLGDDPLRPFFTTSLTGGHSDRIVWRNFWFDVRVADGSINPEESLRGLVRIMTFFILDIIGEGE